MNLEIQPGPPSGKRGHIGTSAVVNGFTILELLVVVAISSMLLAILLPSIQHTRQIGKRIRCQANLKQIASAWHEYLDAHDGCFLQGINTNINYGGQQGAVPAFQGDKPLNEFLGAPAKAQADLEVFHCPADEGSRQIQPTFFGHYGTSYMTNLMLVGQNRLRYAPFDPCKDVFKKINDRLPQLNRTSLANESKLILLGDAGWLNSWNWQDSNRVEWHGEPCGHNLAFMDGHVEFIRIHKGAHTTSQYTVVPFKNLQVVAWDCQKEMDGD